MLWKNQRWLQTPEKQVWVPVPGRYQPQMMTYSQPSKNMVLNLWSLRTYHQNIHFYQQYLRHSRFDFEACYTTNLNVQHAKQPQWYQQLFFVLVCQSCVDTLYWGDEGQSQTCPKCGRDWAYVETCKLNGASECNFLSLDQSSLRSNRSGTYWFKLVLCLSFIEFYSYHLIISLFFFIRILLM